MLPSVTVTVTENVPTTLGVPVIVPVVELMESPVGSPVADQESTAPLGLVAVIGSEIDCPTELA